MPVDSFFDMLTRVCCKYHKRIVDIGELPYDKIRSVLMKIESPEQLHQLEVRSPQIIGHDAELWLAFVKRDIPDWQSKPHEPSDPRSWWKVYKKLKQQSLKDMAQGEDKLKAALDSIKSNKEQSVAQIVTRKELPRANPSTRQRTVHNYTTGRTGSKGASKLSLMEKVKKEARDSRASRMAAPVQTLKKTITTQVMRPPQQFVEDLRRAETQRQQAQTFQGKASPERPIRAPRPPLHAPRPTVPDDFSYREMQDREARLKALATGKAVPKTKPGPTIVLDSPSSPALHKGSDAASSAVSSEPFGRRPPMDLKESAGLSTSFLESPESTPRKILGDALDLPRARSPGRISSPQPSRKRKEPPSAFITTPKRVARPPGIT